MIHCARPIDPIDAEALAAGAEPVLAPGAGDHVGQCPACREQVERAASLARSLEQASGGLVAPDLAGRIVRLRPFSRRERRDFALWRGACSLSAAVFLGGILLLALPGLTAREQASLGIAAMAPLGLLWRALVEAAAQTLAATPSGLKALSQALRQEQTLGLAALALLAPAFLGLSRALARARR